MKMNMKTNFLRFLTHENPSYDAVRRKVYSMPLSIRKSVIGADPDDFCISPLMVAVSRDQPEIAELFLLEGADPREENMRGYSAFNYIRRNGILILLDTFSNARWLGDIVYGTIVNDIPTLNVRWDIIKDRMINHSAGHSANEEVARYLKKNSCPGEVIEYILDFHRHVTLSDMAYYSLKSTI